MPELPEVETVARTLRPRLVGRTVVRVETSGLPLRRPIDKRALMRLCEGGRVDGVRRVGKYLLVEIGPSVVVSHLGMTGRFGFAKAGAPLEPHTHARFLLDDGRELRYVDPRRFGVLRVYPREELARSEELSVLGPDPLSEAFTVEGFVDGVRSSRAPLKAILLDQGRVAGLGNIYVSEALHVAGLRPSRRGETVSRDRAARLHAAIVEVLGAAVQRRGTTLRDYRDADGEGGDNQNHLAVYGREGAPCRRCGAAIRRIVQSARSTYFCPRCQK